MRAIPIPASIAGHYSEMVRRVMAAPSGDLTDTECAPAEVLVGPTGETYQGIPVPGTRIVFTFDDDERRAVADGGAVEFLMYTDRMPMVSAVVWQKEHVR